MHDRIGDLEFPVLGFVSTLPLYILLTESCCLALASGFSKSLLFSFSLSAFTTDDGRSARILTIIRHELHDHHYHHMISTNLMQPC